MANNGSGTGNTLTFGSNGFSGGNGLITLNVTGANGYALTLGSINVNYNQSITLNPTTGNLNLLGITNSDNNVNMIGTGTATMLGALTNGTTSVSLNVSGGTFVFGHGSSFTATNGG